MCNVVNVMKMGVIPEQLLQLSFLCFTSHLSHNRRSGPDVTEFHFPMSLFVAACRDRLSSVPLLIELQRFSCKRKRNAVMRDSTAALLKQKLNGPAVVLMS